MSADGWQAWLGRQQILPALDPGLMSSDATTAFENAAARNQQAFGQLAANALSEKGATRRQQMVNDANAQLRKDEAQLRKNERRGALITGLLNQSGGLGGTRQAGQQLGLDSDAMRLTNVNQVLDRALQLQGIAENYSDLARTNKFIAPAFAIVKGLNSGSVVGAS